MNSLVTGGAGFMGSHLCETLLRKGDNVLCVDNMVSGSLKNIDHLIGVKTFKLLECDVEAIDQIIQQNQEIDCIYHLASPTSPNDVNNHKEMTRRVNSIGTCKLLSLAERIRAKLLFVSSVKIHGDCPRVTDYIYGKRIGEELALSAGAKVARLASVYGPNMSITDSRVIPVFITKMLRKEPISLWNGGTQIDSFCYVNDIVRGLISFMNSQEIGAIEFGAPEGISIKDLAEKIMKLITSDISVRIDESILVVDECHKVVNNWRAKALLDWSPVVSLDDGLKRTIMYFKAKI
jgi:nucleoside-diphosphate-sugar epimerase